MMQVGHELNKPGVGLIGPLPVPRLVAQAVLVAEAVIEPDKM